MLIKANVTFAGDIVMRKGEERELELRWLSPTCSPADM